MGGEDGNFKTIDMTIEKLYKGEALNHNIETLKNQIAYADKIDLLPACKDLCTKEILEFAKPIDKKVRAYLKSALTQELNRLTKEFEKL